MKSKSHNLGFLVGDISRLMRRAYRERQQRSALTVAQARTLVHVARREGVRQIDLADTLEVQPITLARLIDQRWIANWRDSATVYAVGVTILAGDFGGS